MPARPEGCVCSDCFTDAGKCRWLRQGSPSSGGAMSSESVQPSMYGRRPARSMGPPSRKIGLWAGVVISTPAPPSMDSGPGATKKNPGGTSKSEPRAGSLSLDADPLPLSIT
eukprot:4719244-Prymnesium_polylepis.3